MARSDYHLIWNSMFVYEVEFWSVIRGHHVYKAAWSPIIGESLAFRNDDRKEAKEHDEYAVGTYLEADNTCWACADGTFLPYIHISQSPPRE